MAVILAKNWWSLLIRGVSAIVFGGIAVLWRDISLSTLILAFFGYALLDGLVALAGAIRAAEEGERWGSLLIEALAGIGIAVIGAAWPSMTALKFIRLIAAWALVTGVFELISAARLRQYIRGELLMALSGVASLLLAALILTLPLAGVSAHRDVRQDIARWIGAYALFFGVLLVGLGLRLRAWARGLSGIPPEPRESRPAVSRR
jgi:uncharacterized membrane protein HdeD (DUF308 family)